jgi:hypothetical protein
MDGFFTPRSITVRRHKMDTTKESSDGANGKNAVTQGGEGKDSQSETIWRQASILAAAGGFAFWVANLAISLTPIAAEYRAALSIPYLPMLLEALLGGLIIGFCVSYFLLRFFDKVPVRNPLLKSVIISAIVLMVITMLIEVPAKLFTATSDAWRYFLIGAMFNVLRVLALGIVIGCLHGRLNGHGGR